MRESARNAGDGLGEVTVAGAVESATGVEGLTPLDVGAKSAIGGYASVGDAGSCWSRDSVTKCVSSPAAYCEATGMPYSAAAGDRPRPLWLPGVMSKPTPQVLVFGNARRDAERRTAKQDP